MTGSALRAPHRSVPPASPAVKFGVLTPVGTALAYALWARTISHSGLFVALVAAAVVLTVVAIARPWRAADDHRIGMVWQVLCWTLGVALTAPFFVVAMDVDVERFSLLYGLVIVLGTYSYPRGLRIPLSFWTLAVWFATLWWGGIRDLPTLTLHVGGGLVLLATSLRTADALLAAIVFENANRSASEQRAQLLASVLRINSLDPGEVFRAVVSGVVDAGFDAVSIRVLDDERKILRLIDGHHEGDGLPDELPLDAAPLSRQALEQGQSVVIEDRDVMTPHGHQPLRSWVFVPVRGGDQLSAIVAAASSEPALTTAQIEAVSMLAEQAGEALERARGFEADRRTVEKLHELETHMHDFVSTVSHELRTPLTVIHGLGHTLLQRWDELGAERRTDLVSRIDASAERLEVMVSSLLDTSALEHGRLVVTPRRVVLRPLLAALLRRLETVTPDHPVELSVPDDAAARVDRGLFEHVLENLLVNVARHTPPGTRTTVDVTVDAERVIVTVSDDGPGIPAADLPFVLDRFYRGGGVAERPTGGLGLGLALAQQILLAHGSELHVSSVEGQGTTFRFEVAADTAPGAGSEVSADGSAATDDGGAAPGTTGADVTEVGERSDGSA